MKRVDLVPLIYLWILIFLTFILLYLRQRSSDGLDGHVLPVDHDEGEDLEEDGGADRRQAGLLSNQGRVPQILGLVVELQLGKRKK